MITPNAKCVVNGKKLNSLIIAYNDLLTNLVSEEFDVVVNNYPDKRYLVTGNLSALVSGQSGEDEGSERGTLGGTGGGTGQGTASTNRDQLNTNPAGGGGALKDDGGVNPPVLDEMPKFNGGGALKADGTTTRGGTGGGAMPKYTGGAMVAGDAGQAARDFDDTLSTGGGGGAFGGGTDAFGNELYADGTRVTPSGMGGALKDDGTTTAGGGDSYPPPRVGAPPLTGDEPADDTPSSPPPATEPKADSDRIANYHNNATYGMDSRDDVREYKLLQLKKIRDRVSKYNKEIQAIAKKYPDIRYANSKAPQSVRHRFNKLIEKRKSARKQKERIHLM